MIQNSEEYKLISIDSLGFSVRLTNVAHRNGIATLYELVESYNSGEFEKMRNVGASTVQELLNFDFLTAVFQEEPVPEVVSADIDEIIPADFLDSDIDEYVYDIILFNHLRRHGVKKVRDVEPFLATKSMEEGDLVLLHVGSQNKKYESGIYSYGTIVKGPYILEDSPEDYCNNKNTCDVGIDYICYGTPLISHADSTEFIKQFRTVHMINEECGDNLSFIQTS